MPQIPADLVEQAIEAKGYTQSFLLMPARWRAYAYGPLAWAVMPLEEDGAGSLPEQSAIYALVAESGVAPPLACYPFYIGQTVHLRTRFRQYLREEVDKAGRPKIALWLRMYHGYVRFWYAFVPRSDLDAVEKDLVRALKPPANDDVIDAEIRAVHKAFQP